MEKKRGGKRKGAGRKKLPDNLFRKNRAVRMNDEEYELYKEAGGIQTLLKYFLLART